MATYDDTPNSPSGSNHDAVSTPRPMGAATGLDGAGTGVQARDFVQRVAQTAHQTIDKLAERVAPAAQHLQEGVVGANESLHQRAEQVRELGDEWVESLRGTVREHPVAAVATALALGLLVARLVR